MGYQVSWVWMCSACQQLYLIYTDALFIHMFLQTSCSVFSGRIIGRYEQSDTLLRVLNSNLSFTPTFFKAIQLYSMIVLYFLKCDSTWWKHVDISEASTSDANRVQYTLHIQHSSTHYMQTEMYVHPVHTYIHTTLTIEVEPFKWWCSPPVVDQTIANISSPVAELSYTCA